MSFADELRLPRRDLDAHKGNFGRVLIVAGSRGMAGAAVLATGGCLRSGVGLLTVAAPASAIGQVAFAYGAAMTLALPGIGAIRGSDRVGGLAVESLSVSVGGGR
jgi:NAD(P)H-hydrate repair Nnr-like enzyme with NAD(P)H-hydrate dehydratase domain